MTDTTPKAWIIVEQKGKILPAHCNCMAGLGETCSHVEALLFYVEAAVRIRDSKTVTQEKAYWLLPSAHKDVEYKEVADIDFTAPKILKRKMDYQIDNGSKNPKSQTQRKSCFERYGDPTNQDVSDFYTALSKCGSKPARLSIISPYSKNYVPKLLNDTYPKILTELYDLNTVDKNYLELSKICENIELSVTQEQAATVERETRCQSEDRSWFQFRAGRITASKIYSVCHTRTDLPSQSLIKSICYPESYKFSSDSTNWGCQREKTARDLYSSGMADIHENFTVKDAGLHISTDHPFVGASPDGLVSCNSCEDGCLEIKCPYCHKGEFIFEAAEGNKFCIEKVGTEYKLKRNHPYYYQVQAQLGVCNKKYCDFYFWTKQDFHYERIYPDIEFWGNCLKNVRTFSDFAFFQNLWGNFIPE